jgi:ribosomal protein L7Ae-like RNA K-turn-binding protein
MSLYFVHHQHSAETCPARDPEMGKMLLQHLTKANARKYGIDLLADAVLDARHTLVLIAEAEDPQYLQDFMLPFARAGTVEINAASTCEAVVERQGCDPVSVGA